MEKNKVIRENEEKGREIFKTLVDQYKFTVSFTQNTEDRVDLIFNDLEGYKYVGEIKRRTLKYQNLDTYLLEKSKLDSILGRQIIEGALSSFYINIFGDTDIYMFCIPEIIQYISEGKINREEGSYRKNHWTMDYIVKPVYMLPKEYSLHLRRNEGVWRKIE